MIEAGANEVPEDKMLEAIALAHDENKKIIDFIDGIVKEHGKPKREYQQHVIPKELYEKVTAFITDTRMEDAVFSDLKQVRDENMNKITEEVYAELFPHRFN